MDTPDTPRHKGYYLLPNLITTLSLFSGFVGMVWAVGGEFQAAGMAILFAAIMDGLDGKVARLTHSASEFGIQYDSLSDLVAFGVSPAILMWCWKLHSFGNLGIAAAFIFAACGALRLARFNISTAVTSKAFFIGLPIPAAGCTAATFVFFQEYLPFLPDSVLAACTLVLTPLLGILMVSRVRYISFKEYGFLRRHPFRYLVIVLLLFSLIAAQPRLLGFLLCLSYIAFGLVYTFIIMPRRNRELMRNLSTQGE